MNIFKLITKIFIYIFESAIFWTSTYIIISLLYLIINKSTELNISDTDLYKKLYLYTYIYIYNTV